MSLWEIFRGRTKTPERIQLGTAKTYNVEFDNLVPGFLDHSGISDEFLSAAWILFHRTFHKDKRVYELKFSRDRTYVNLIQKRQEGFEENLDALLDVKSRIMSVKHFEGIPQIQPVSDFSGLCIVFKEVPKQTQASLARIARGCVEQHLYDVHLTVQYEDVPDEILKKSNMPNHMATYHTRVG